MESNRANSKLINNLINFIMFSCVLVIVMNFFSLIILKSLIISPISQILIMGCQIIPLVYLRKYRFKTSINFKTFFTILIVLIEAQILLNITIAEPVEEEPIIEDVDPQISGVDNYEI